MKQRRHFESVCAKEFGQERRQPRPIRPNRCALSNYRVNNAGESESEEKTLEPRKNCHVIRIVHFLKNVFLSFLVFLFDLFNFSVAFI